MVNWGKVELYSIIIVYINQLLSRELGAIVCDDLPRDAEMTHYVSEYKIDYVLFHDRVYWSPLGLFGGVINGDQ